MRLEMDGDSPANATQTAKRRKHDTMVQSELYIYTWYK